MNRLRSTMLLITCFLASRLIGAPNELAESANLSVEIATGLSWVTEIAIEPAGQRVAYTLTVPRDLDDEPGGAWKQIWIAALDGSNDRRYTPEKENSHSPAWMPDGASIAFISKRGEDEHAQIYLLPIDGGEADRLTDSPTGVASFEISPSGHAIAFSAVDEKSEETIEDEDAGRDWEIVDRHERFKRLHVIELDSHETKTVYDEPIQAGNFVWSPDGKSLVFVGAPTGGADDVIMNSSLYRVALDGGEPKRVCETPGKLGGIAVSPDGKTLAYLGAVSRNDPLPQSVFVVPIEGGEPRNLTGDFQGSAHHVLWGNDGLLFSLYDHGVLSAGTAQSMPHIDTPMSISAVDVPLVTWEYSHQGTTDCFIAHAPHHLAEAYVSDSDAGSLTRLTNHNPILDELDLASMQSITWRSTDGMEIDGVLTLPPNRERDRKLPLIVNPHGGPEAASQLGWSTFAQLLAARGFAVLQPNYRGSAGCGVEFSKGDHDDLGGQEFQDILAGIDHLAQEGVIDRDRVGIAGWSYGGYLSALAATHHSDRFRAAVMGAGISNWVSFTGGTDIPDEMSTVHWNRSMFDNDNIYLYWQRSPLAHVGKCQTPTLILFGKGDDRVPPSQGYELHHALKEHGVPTEFVLYPRAGHGVEERAHRIDLYQRQIDWLEKYVLEEVSAN